MRWLLLLLLLAAAALAAKRKARRAPTHRATHRPQATPAPSVAPPPSGAPPSAAPVGAHTAAEYFYYAELYQERADFLYKFFPHSGPSFYSAQADAAKARFYEALGDAELAKESATAQPSAQPGALGAEEEYEVVAAEYEMEGS